MSLTANWCWFDAFFVSFSSVFFPPNRQRCQKKNRKKKEMMISFGKKLFIWVACWKADSSACKTMNCTLLEGCGFVLFCFLCVYIWGMYLFIGLFLILIKDVTVACQAMYCILNRVMICFARFCHNCFSHWCLWWDGFIKQHQKLSWWTCKNWQISYVTLGIKNKKHYYDIKNMEWLFAPRYD